jgi:hypothetical protein
LSVCLAFVLAWPGAARADYIPGFPDAPGGTESFTNIDITSYGLTVNYDGGSHELTVYSQSSFGTLINDGNEELDGTGDLSIAITIDPLTGIPQPGGTLSITGDAPDYGGSSGNILTGTISQFGFALPADAEANHSSEHFQFIFNTTGGDLASYYPSIAVNLTIVDLDTDGGSFTTDGTFASSFSDISGNAQTDTYAAPAPEPSTLALACLGVFVLMIAKFGILRGRVVLCWSPRG